MSKFIVITSIFEPTDAVRGFVRQADHDVLVVGDRKSPAAWHCGRAQFLSVGDQEALGYELGRHLPYNHYCRKMLGYLHAMQAGASVIVDTDDDNIPGPGWGFPDFSGELRTVRDGLGFVNIYELYTGQKIWPRGYPLRLVNRRETIPAQAISGGRVEVGVWQGLADEDPDVDAIYRLTSDEPCIFRDAGTYVLGRGTVTPFNSQNTAFRRELFPLLYLPAFVTFRFTDILRGLVAQPVMWAHGYRLGFTGATVVQKRNPHDYMKDFESEIPMYLHAEKVVDLAAGSVSPGRSIGDNLHAAYGALHSAGIVCGKEMEALDAWLADCSRLAAKP